MQNSLPVSLPAALVKVGYPRVGLLNYKKGSTLKTSPKQRNLTAKYPTSTQKKLALSTKGRENLNCRESSDLTFQDSKDFIRPHCLVGEGVSLLQAFNES